MKPVYSIIAFCMLLTLAFSPFLKKEFNGDNLTISILDNNETYKFSAEYNGKKNLKIREYMGKELKRKEFFNTNPEEIVKYEINNVISIKSYSDELKIVFDKKHNSKEAYRKIKEVAQGIKTILGENKVVKN